MGNEDDNRLDFPATGRNKDAIHDVLAGRLGGVTTVLEIASGSGQHVAHLAPLFPHITWQPSDLDDAHRASIAAWTTDLENVLPPLALDATATWRLQPVDAIICLNMIHIAPWEACLGLFARAAEVLTADGILYLYGPFMEDGRHNADSNARFDESLKSRDPQWGIRDLTEVKAAAAGHGLAFAEKLAMPANNFSVFFRRHVSTR